MKETFAIIKPGDEARSLYERVYNQDIPNPVGFSNEIYGICMKSTNELADKIKLFIKQL